MSYDEAFAHHAFYGYAIACYLAVAVYVAARAIE